MQVIYGLIVLGFMVFFHELGHFITAKKAGVSVESFSIGMGPVIFHKTFGSTDYRLSLFPIGGYCGMKGEKDFSNALTAGLSSIPAEKNSLYGIHPILRALIGFSGPLANMILAFLSFTVIAMVGYSYYSYSSKITITNEQQTGIHSAAYDAGLKTGDTILKINNTPIENFSDIAMQISTHPDENVKVVVLRNNKKLNFTVHTDIDKSTGSGKIGVAADPNSVTSFTAKKYSFFSAIFEGLKQTGNMLLLSYKSIGILFKGVQITNAVSGPARIVTMLGDTVKQGFSAGLRNGLVGILQLTAIINISLFIMNLLPIPVLDGGLILFAFLEWIRRKPVKPSIQYKVQFIGIAFIAFLFILGITGDIKYFSTLLRTK